MSSWTAGLGLLMVLGSAAAPGWAQPTAPAPAASAAAGPVGSSAAAASDEAMERVRRQAANPMRMILEAGRNAAPASKPAAAARPVEEPAGATARQAVQALPAATRAPRELKLRSALLQEPADAAEQALQPLAAEAAMPSWASELPGAVPGPALLPPRLLSMVEPDLPSAMMQGPRRITELAVDLRLRSDGGVAEVVVAAPAPQALVRAVVQALEQWRYEPQGRERLHRVLLVFNADR